MSTQSMNRREFLMMTGGTVMLLPFVAALAGCGSSNSGSATPIILTPGTTNGDFNVTSASDATGHTHGITVKAADLTAGVQVTYTASSVIGHTHTVVITPAQITTINAGGTAGPITSSTDAGHSHTFSIKKP